MNEELKAIMSKLDNARAKTPILLLSKAAELFKQYYKNNIIVFNNRLDLNQFEANVNTLQIIELNNVNSYIDVLIDFIDINDYYLVLLVDDKDIDKRLLSRVKVIIKSPYNSDGTCAVLTPNQALDKLKTLDTSENSSFYASYSPSLKYLKNNASSYVSTNKIIQLVGDIL